MRTTLSQIAEKSGVSKPTVSHILGEKGHLYRHETRMKVLLAASSLGYQPNSYARGMAKGSFGSIGLLLSTNSASATLASGTSWAIQEELLKRGLHLVVGQVPDTKLTDDGVVPRLLSEWAVDGLLISYTHAMPPRMLDLIHKNRGPSVWINAKLPSDSIYPDDFSATQGGTEYLLGLGHRRIAYLSFPTTGHYSVTDRREGYVHAMQSAGRGTQFLSTESVAESDWFRSVTALFSMIDRPTAVITYSAAEAEVALLVAARLGLQIPEELSMLVIRDQGTPLCGIPVSTLEVPVYPMGYQAVEMVCQKIAGAKASTDAKAVGNAKSTLDSIAVPYTQVHGSTCTRAE